jgi:hypothetical protein
MFRLVENSAMVGLCFVTGGFSQTPAKVDFGRDVQPIFRQNCIGWSRPH